MENRLTRTPRAALCITGRVEPKKPESPKANLQIKGGMNAVYLCSYCNYSHVPQAEGPCYNCEKGRPRPNLEFIREMSQKGLSIHDVAHL